MLGWLITPAAGALLDRLLAAYSKREDAKTEQAKIAADAEVRVLEQQVAAQGQANAVRRLNAADIRGACEAMTWWNKAGGRVVRGLVARRTAERELCLAGLQ